MTFLDQNQKTKEELRKAWLDQCYNNSHSHNSLHVAQVSLVTFDKFLKIKFPNIEEPKVIQELKKIWTDPQTYTKLYQFLNDYVQFLISENLHPTTVKVYFSYLKSYLRFNGIRIYNEDIKQFVKQPKKIKESRMPLSRENVIKLLEQAEKKWKAIILVGISSGARLGEILQSTPLDYDFKAKPITMRIRAETTKTKQERSTFISQEAYKHIKPLLKDRTHFENGFLFIKEWNKDSIRTAEATFSEIRKRAGLTEKYQTSNRYKINFHATRAFFQTKATDKHGGDWAHKMIGHGKYLDQYYRPEANAEKYLELEPLLTIFKEPDVIEDGIKASSLGS
jgi:integrase